MVLNNVGRLGIITGSYKGQRRCQSKESEVTGGERELRRGCAVGFEDGGWDHGPRNVGRPQKLDQARKRILPQSLQENAALPTSFILLTSRTLR